MLPLPVNFLWLPAAAVGAHLIEEFVWPGDFAEWYRRYRPDRAASITPRFLVIVNTVLVALALLPPVLGSTVRGLGFWLVVAAIGAVNAVFHVAAVVRMREYSPGVVTAICFYIPLAFAGYQWFVVTRRLSTGMLVQAVVFGVGFHLWSAWNHKRRAAKLAG